MLGSSIVESEVWGAIEHLVHTAHRHLSMEAAFLAEVTATEQLYRATAGPAETFTITTGGALPRLEGFCHHMLERDGPWVVPDTSGDPVAAVVPVHTIGDFGAYIGVPVRHPDGRNYGSLCCISHDPVPRLGDRDAAVLSALADVLGFHIGQLEDARGDRERLAGQHEDLRTRLRQHELQLGLMAELVKAARTPAMVLDPRTLAVEYANPAASELVGMEAERLVGAPLSATSAWDERVVRERLAPVVEGEQEVVRFEVDDATADEQIVDVVAQWVELADGSTSILLV